MKTTMHRQFAVGDLKYLIEISEFEIRYVLAVSLEGKNLLTKSYWFSDEAMIMGKRWCYLDAGARMGILDGECDLIEVPLEEVLRITCPNK
jgi:hypothetical protein